MKAYDIIKKSLAAVGATLLLAGCSEDFLAPEPLSFYEPAVTFSTESGLQAALAMCDRHLRVNYIWYNHRDQDSPLGADYLFSDYMCFGMTDTGAGFNDNFVRRTTPNGDGSKGGFLFGAFWDEGYNCIKYANGVIGNIPRVKGLEEEKKNAYLGRGYFHRAYSYYYLIFNFGDVPLVTKILEVPKQNYRSTAKEAIIKKMIEDLEFAVEWVPTQAETQYYGMITKGACQHLLIKYYLADGRFKDAENLATELIESSGYSLMYEPFGTDTRSKQTVPETWAITRNVIWDLHRPENKIGAFNKESILGAPNLSEQSFVSHPWMRIYVPFWADGSAMTPDGKQAVMRIAESDGKYDPTTDWNRALGRGIAVYRPTYYTQHAMWVVDGEEDKEDLRHNSKVGNWVNMEDIRYNNPASAYHGQNLRLTKEGAVPNPDGTWKREDLLFPDTLRSWFDFPLYKYYYFDQVQSERKNAAGKCTSTDFQGSTKGSNGNLYIFRLAETYLLRAEARLYQNNLSGAASDLNELRRRAKCSRFYGGSVNIGDIMNERGRELYMEEFRHSELVRVSMIMAKNGIPDEWGNTYSESNWDKQEGTDRNGGSYWYQRLMHYNYYNRDGAINSGKWGPFEFLMGKHNLYWPIKKSAIEANKKGQLWQNYGYEGYDESIPVWQTWQEAVADEDIAG